MEKTGGKAMVPSCNYINLLNKDNKNTFLYSWEKLQMSLCNLKKLESGEACKRQVHHTFLPVINILSKTLYKPKWSSHLDSACFSFLLSHWATKPKKLTEFAECPSLKCGIRGVLFVHGAEQQLEKYHFQSLRLTVITCWWPGGMIAQRTIRTCVLQILVYTLSFE